MNKTKLEIFEPALCCDTGVCGVSVDPEILRITSVVNHLKSKGFNVNRYNLSSAPMEFITNQIVNKYLNDNGVDGLPVTLLNDEIIIVKEYPTNKKISEIFGITEDSLDIENKEIEPTTTTQNTCGCEGGCQ